MANFNQEPKYNRNWQSGKFKNVTFSGSNLSQFVNDAGYVTIDNIPQSSGSANTGSLLITASFSDPNLTFTKGDGNTFDVNISNLTSISASYALTASFYQETDPIFVAKSASLATTGSNLFIGTQEVSGALQLNPTIDPGNSNVTSSFFFVTSSGDNTEFNLHYRNNGALWETHWLEERTDTGIVWGGVTTFSESIMYITPGAGLIVNHNASTGSHGDTIPTYVEFGPITASATFITSSQVTYLLIDENGNLEQQTSVFTPQQYNEKFPLGYIFCLTTSSISSFADSRVTTYGQDEQQSQFIRAFGPLKVNGYDITPQSGSLKISIASGRTYRAGGFYTQDPENPSIYDSNTIATGSLIRVYRDPSAIGGFRATLNGLVPFTDIDPTKWDDGSGTLKTVNSNEWTIQRIFQGVVNGISYVYYGQNTYDSLNAAIQSITTEAFEESQTSIIALPFIGYVITRGNTTDLNDTINNKIINSGLFRNTAGASGGGGVATTTLNDLSDVSILSPNTGQALVYNAGLWENGSPLNSTSASFASTASYVENAISSSYAISASYAPYSTGNLATAQARRTTGYTLTIIPALITFNTTDVENQPSIISHDNINTERIYVYSDGLYSIHYHCDVAQGTTVNDFEFAVTKNTLTVLNGSLIAGKNSSTDKMTVGITSQEILTAGDYVSLAARYVASSGGIVNNAVLSVTKMEGVAGPQGPSGSAGQGVTINNNTDNYLVTATGTTDVLNGEANATFNGSTLAVTGNITATSFTGSLEGTASYATFAPENSSTSGVGTTPTATQTDTITHNLGRTPVKIRIYGMGGFTNNASATPTPFSIGTWTSSGNRCIYQPIGATITAAATPVSSTTFAIRIDSAANSNIQGVIQNITNTTFQIAWTETGNVTARVYMWEAE